MENLQRKIFPANPQHIEALVALDMACFSYGSREDAATWRSQLAETQVFLVHGKVIGAVVVRGDELYSLAVHPEYQSKGYGAALVRAAIKQGARRLWVRENNSSAQSLYTKMSFFHSGKSKQCDNDTSKTRFIEMVLRSSNAIDE